MSFSLSGFLKGLLLQDPVDRSKQLALEVSSGATTGTTTTIVAAQTADRTVTLPDSNLDMNTLLTTSSTIDLDQLELVTANRVLQSDGDGTISASSVTSTSLSYLDATSSIQTQLNSKVSSSATIDIAHGGTGQTTATAAINALLPSQSTHSGQFLTSDGTNTSWASTGAGGGATTALDNLTSTAVNTNINPDSNNTHSLGNSVGQQWSEVDALRTVSTLSPDVMISGVLTGVAGFTGVGIANAGIASFGITQSPIYVATVSDSVSNTVATGDVVLITGDKSAGTGNSGSVVLETGTSAGGTRGSIQIVDGSEGSAGSVWTSVDASGNGTWSVPVSGGVTNWTTFTPGCSWNTNVVVDGYKRLVGDGAEVMYRVVTSGMPNAAELTFDPPSGMTPDAGFINFMSTVTTPAGGFYNGAFILPLSTLFAGGKFVVFYNSTDTTAPVANQPLHADQGVFQNSPTSLVGGETLVIRVSYKI